MHVAAESIRTAGAPPALGPYSQAIRSGQWLFVSGQLPLDPSSGELISDEIGAQTHRVLQNLGAILEAAGGSFEHVVRTTVFLVDLGDFATMNRVYSEYFGSPAPSRSTVQVAALPKSARLEIDAIAILSRSTSA